MAQTHPLPKWGVTMEEGTIGEWYVQVGDAVAEGQVLGLVETDKIEVELESPEGGIIADLLAQKGDNVACGAPVVVIATDADDLEMYRAGRTAPE
jgi:pyruvate/2-oxoglutarate dehydrogenase complex dihydrolipoamide acyltransferase (E2) component